MSIVKTKSLAYDQMKIVQAFPRSTNVKRSARDGFLHIVWNERNLNTACGLMVADLLEFMPITEFGRPGEDWCKACGRKLAAREAREGI